MNQLHTSQCLHVRRQRPVLSPGEVIEGHVQLTHQIQQSELGMVFGAEDRNNGVVLILKLPLVEPCTYAWHTQRCLDLRAEASILRKITARGIPAPLVHEIGHYHDWPYLALRSIPGQTLAALQREGKLSRRKALQVVARICVPLYRVHQLGYVHNDIKESNILIRADGLPALLDWGSAEPIRTQSQYRPTRSLTPAYAPIEQLQGYTLPTNDVHALGHMLSELIQSPGPRLQRIIDRATAPLGQRYTDTLELGRDLLRLLKLDRLVRRLELLAY